MSSRIFVAIYVGVAEGPLDQRCQPVARSGRRRPILHRCEGGEAHEFGPGKATLVREGLDALPLGVEEPRSKRLESLDPLRRCFGVVAGVAFVDVSFQDIGRDAVRDADGGLAHRVPGQMRIPGGGLHPGVTE